MNLRRQVGPVRTGPRSPAPPSRRDNDSRSIAGAADEPRRGSRRSVALSPSAISGAVAPGLTDVTEALRWPRIRRDDEWAVDNRGQPPTSTILGRRRGENRVCVYDSVYSVTIDVLIDTQNDVCDASSVLKTKRTYNLSRRTIETVQALVADRGVAPSQDALVELAVDELARHVREADEADAWAAAAVDPEFIAEAAELEAAYRTADAETWPKA